jgi:hypothetical protein
MKISVIRMMNLVITVKCTMDIQMLIPDCEREGLSPLFLVALKVFRLHILDREILVTLKFRAKLLIAGRKSKGRFSGLI